MSGLRDAVKVVLALASMLISALLVHAYYGSLSPALALLVTAVIAGLGGGLVFGVAQRRTIERQKKNLHDKEMELWRRT